MNKLIRLLLICLLVLGAADLRTAFAAEERESLRERIRARRAEPSEADLRKPGTHERALMHDGRRREYLVHVPKGYDGRKPAPLVVAMHGGGGNMHIQANDTYYGLVSKADETGTIIVFPNGYSRRKNESLATWNAGECCAAAVRENSDDVGFIRAMLAEVRRRYNIDSDRIFATGMSNGGLMSYRLACEMSDVFRAIAPVAGTDNTVSCKPKRPVSVLHIHAKDDTHVLFEGGAGPDVIKYGVTDFTSVPSTISKWVGLNSCKAKPIRVLENAGAYCELYAGCADGARVQLCVTEEGGHSWPGGEKPRGNGTPSRAISATDVMWKFFGL
jgi:polyhydroxybutyrate depolymerase